MNKFTSLNIIQLFKNIKICVGLGGCHSTPKTAMYRLHRPMCGKSILKLSIYKIGETLVFRKVINASYLRLMRTENSLVVQMSKYQHCLTHKIIGNVLT